MAEKALSVDYTPLAQTTEIRILNLEQGTYKDPVVCTLCPVLRSEAKYHALSYEWGDEGDDDPSIIVTNRPVQIRRNLYEALKRIRKPSDDIQLWVDAICINQSDIQEKNYQVAMMGKTFADATGFISWLGPVEDDSDLAMDLMSNSKELEANLSSYYGESRELKSLTSLCYRLYWRRVWIIQELYLAQSYEVWCGATYIPDEEFEKSLAVLNAWITPFTQELGRNPANQHRTARLVRDLSFNYLRRWIWVCFRGGFQCSREQDFIYALLNISEEYKDGEMTFKVDYAKSPREVFLGLVQDRPTLWSEGSKDRWFTLARMMNLQIDEDLTRSVLAYYSTK
ncbi:hypothetical protein KAF25_005842 [Fusarium avenaceum]|uniref:Heterokaryon incompatibility domain-containing protein n=1 Tax=Fusarium avenaceum TaxID=40199 RepID=A0A9P7KNH8_9HYPO|nr:hypothetical protein KAF25_005842 [Fusarium avenaceum]